MHITKMHGLGNDFIIIENLQGRKIDYPAVSEKICRRCRSVGADGILVVEKSEIADIAMRIFNSDGSEAQMCGNGIRCFARYVTEREIVPRKPGGEITVETGAGIMKPAVFNSPESPGGILIRVNMGRPIFEKSKIPMTGENSSMVIDEKITADGVDFRFSAVSMGNPHCVIIVDRITDRHVRHFGPVIHENPIFPQKTNVEFMEIIDRNHIRMRVWERGAGETLACGTGACACTALGRIRGLLNSDVTVSLPGGDLFIKYEPEEEIFMTGPAVEVFSGEVTEEALL